MFISFEKKKRVVRGPWAPFYKGHRFDILHWCYDSYLSLSSPFHLLSLNLLLAGGLPYQK